MVFANGFGVARRTLGNVLAGASRLAFFGGGKRLKARGAHAPILIVIGMLTLCTLSFLAAGTNRYFNPYGVAVALSTYLAAGLACCLAAVIHGRPRRSIALFAVVVSMAPAAIVEIYLVDLYFGQPVIFVWLTDPASAPFGLTFASYCAYLAVYSALVFPGRFMDRPVRTACSTLVLAATVWGYLAIVPAEPIWESWTPKPDAARESRINVERTFYRQPELVARALDEIAPSRRGISDLYFVGFAGYGSEQVFSNEVGAAADVLAQRFDSGGRTVRLANSRRTVDDLPIASASNLRLVLSGIARKMDVAEDVLFLFLSSHGSKGRLAVQFWPLSLNDLSASELREMLDAAGIKWRVIVVSACYSGSFIEALRNENTLIITAAAADKTSFGCGHDGPFTYFGEAFFKHALHEQLSFRDAFKSAKARVEERERTEGLTPSEPQLYEGEHIVEKLKTIEFRLAQIARVRALRSAQAPPED